MEIIIDKLISIIIPVYNVEMYLERCIESVVNQTYRNLQIILVDDGSTDTSGRLCDSYADGDNRIKVIHKDNGGLSDARNAGIDVATGNYIMFVDSDDWIREDCVEILAKALQYSKKKISVCKYQKTNKWKISEVRREIDVVDYVEEWTIEEAYRHLFLCQKIDNSVCAKLYEHSLFQEIRFPVGKLYEDQFTTYKLFHIAQGITFVEQEMYFYYNRQGSIQNENFSLRKMDELDAAKECVDFIRNYYPHLLEEAYCRLVSSCFHILFSINDKKRWEQQVNRLQQIIMKYRIRMIFGKNINKKVRLGCLCTCLGFCVTQWIYRKTGVKGKINI